jgi:hypothetical protein
MPSRTCLTCARFVYQETEEGVRPSLPVWLRLTCSRDRYSLALTAGVGLENIREKLESAGKCDQYYEAAALGVEA